jgi:hypothetical protein
MSTEQHIIDPNRFSSEELLKMVYRDVQTLNVKMDEIQKDYVSDKRVQDEKISAQNLQIAQLRTIIEEKEKSFKSSIGIISIALTVLSLLSGFAGWVLNK